MTYGDGVYGANTYGVDSIPANVTVTGISPAVVTMGATVLSGTGASIVPAGIRPPVVVMATPTLGSAGGATINAVTIVGTTIVTVGGNVRLAIFPEADFTNQPNGAADAIGNSAMSAEFFDHPYAGDTWYPLADITMNELSCNIMNNDLAADVDTNNGGADIVLSG